MDLNKAYLPRVEDVKERWEVIDAAGQTVGRLATQVAKIARGKNLVISTPHVKTGPRIIIINADKVVFTGNKMEEKSYWRYTGYRGNRKVFTSKELIMEGNSKYILEHAIKGMMRKCKLENQIFDDILIYEGTNHPHKAQILRKA